MIKALPRAVVGNDTPYFKLFGKQVNLSYSRTIGAKAFLHVKTCNGKLEPEACGAFLVR